MGPGAVIQNLQYRNKSKENREEKTQPFDGRKKCACVYLSFPIYVACVSSFLSILITKFVGKFSSLGDLSFPIFNRGQNRVQNMLE